MKRDSIETIEECMYRKFISTEEEIQEYCIRHQNYTRQKRPSLMSCVMSYDLEKSLAINRVSSIRDKYAHYLIFCDVNYGLDRFPLYIHSWFSLLDRLDISNDHIRLIKLIVTLKYIYEKKLYFSKIVSEWSLLVKTEKIITYKQLENYRNFSFDIFSQRTKRITNKTIELETKNSIIRVNKADYSEEDSTFLLNIIQLYSDLLFDSIKE